MTNSEEDSASSTPSTSTAQSNSNSNSPNPTPIPPPLDNSNSTANGTPTPNTNPKTLLNGNHSNNLKSCMNGSGDSSDISTSSSLSSSTSSHSGGSELQLLPFPLICAETKIWETSTGGGGGTSDHGLLVLTNYRLWIQQGKESLRFNLPLGLIDSVEPRDLFFLHVFTKTGRWARVTFPTNEAVLESTRQIQALIIKNMPLTQNFAFKFKGAVESGALAEDLKIQLGFGAGGGSEVPDESSSQPQSQLQKFLAEVNRMGFNIQNPWRLEENTDYKLCSSYPKYLIVPNSIDKKKLEQVACFRSARRFPAVVWRHRGNGAVICRCSQPEVGLFGWRSSEDEELVQNIIQACAYQAYENQNHYHQTVPVPGPDSWLSNGSMQHVPPAEGPSLWPPAGAASGAQVMPNNSGQGPGPGGAAGAGPPAQPQSSMELVPEFTTVKKLLILDARSYTTAVVNRARGGGCECLEYYPNCEIQFMNLANIHSIRKSFINLRTLCSSPLDQTNWYSQLEGTKWIQHMSGLMKAALTVVTAVESDGRPVMVHCSDGWDRTPQIVSLAEILLDPYYRSLEGFQVLVEREWLDFGHKFGDRCGQGSGSDDGNERCPVFLQWLDCLHQLLKQYPSAFEFNMSFLVKLVQHTYSNLFGTFLCNSAKEREENSVFTQTISVWNLLRSPKNSKEFRNSLYKSCDTVLWPSCEVRDLALWSQVYLGYDHTHHPSLQMLLSDPGLLVTCPGTGEPSQESSPAPSVIDDGGCGGVSRSTSASTHPKSTSSPSPPSTSKKHGLRGRSSSCENLMAMTTPIPVTTVVNSQNLSSSTYAHPLGKGLTRKLSDSSLYAHEPEEAEKRELLEKAMTDLTTTSSSTSSSPSPAQIPNQTSSQGLHLQHQNGNINSHIFQANLDSDSEEEEEEEELPTSESTVINQFQSHQPHHLHHQVQPTTFSSKFNSNPHLKSIESSTDTLIAGDISSALPPIPFQTNCLEFPTTENSVGDSNVNWENPEETWRNCNSDEDGPLPLNLNNINLTLTDPCSICEKGRNFMRKIRVSPPTTSSGILTPGHSNSKNHSIHSHRHNHNNLQLLDKDSFAGSSSSSTSTTATAAVGAAAASSSRDRYSMDVDGLTHFHDETQHRVNSIVDELRNQIEGLRREVDEYRSAFLEQVSHKCHHQHCSLVDRLDDAISVSGSEQHSVLSQSSEASSFEHVEERDVYPPLWVPDFAVTSCHGCYLKFSLGRRKHHCRACGRVFCSDCSENFISLPQEQIFVPSRVCKGCFNKYGGNNGSNGNPNPAPDSSSSTESLILISREQYAQLSETLANSAAAAGAAGSGGSGSKKSLISNVQNGHGHSHSHGSPPQSQRNPTTTFKPSNSKPNFE